MAISRALGARIKRREDPRLITGTATYVDDIMLPGLLHVIFVRSPHAHAKVTAIDTEAARRAPGVAVVWTGEDVATRCGPLPIGPRIRDMKVPKRYPLVIDGVVRHVGDPVAVVVATDLAASRHAADLVEVTYEPLAAVIDLEAAMRADGPVIHPDLGTNACFRVTFGSPVDEVFASAEKTVSLRLIQQRLVPTAMETRGVVAHYKGGELTLWTSTQIPHVVKTTVADTVRLPEHQVGVFTNCTPTGAHRGAGRPEATFLIERVVDAVARALAMDPAEVRRRNFIPPEAFPFKTPTGATYDSGNYEQALDKALQMVEYKALREEQRRLRGQGRYLGIELSSYVEITGLGAAAALPGGLWESATVRVEPTGKVTVLTGSSPHGQGEETTFAQIVTDRLGVPVDDVVVVHGDTRAVPYGVGTFGSRNTAIGGSAVFIASDRIREKAVRIAAHLLEAAPGDVEHDGARFQVRGSPQRAVEFKDVARAAYKGAKLPPGTEPGLEVTHFLAPPERVFPFGTHVCVVEIDPQTGEVMIRRYVAADDCGTILNPLLVAGQVHGGIAQGLAQALYEEAVYDESGQLLTAGLPDYAVPKAAQLPAFDLGHTVTPSPHNPLGAKGVGEAGTIGATPAVVNAVLDALAPLGITHLDMPLTPRKIWEAIRMGGSQPGSRSSSRPSP